MYGRTWRSPHAKSATLARRVFRYRSMGAAVGAHEFTTITLGTTPPNSPQRPFIVAPHRSPPSVARTKSDLRPRRSRLTISNQHHLPILSLFGSGERHARAQDCGHRRRHRTVGLRRWCRPAHRPRCRDRDLRDGAVHPRGAHWRPPPLVGRASTRPHRSGVLGQAGGTQLSASVREHGASRQRCRSRPPAMLRAAIRLPPVSFQARPRSDLRAAWWRTCGTPHAR